MSIYLEDDEHIQIAKANDDQNLVFGWANVALKADGNIPLDWQGDVIPPQVLESAAYQFVLKYRETGERHMGDCVGYLVESMMFTKEKMQTLGIPEGTLPEAWWIGFYIPDDDVYAKVKSGQYRMFSIEGRAMRNPIEEVI